MDAPKKRCMLHFEDLKTTTKLSDCSLKGAKSIQESKSVYESSNDPTLHKHLQICIEIDQNYWVFPWKEKRYHPECFKKFTRKVLTDQVFERIYLTSIFSFLSCLKY